MNIATFKLKRKKSIDSMEMDGHGADSKMMDIIFITMPSDGDYSMTTADGRRTNTGHSEMEIKRYIEENLRGQCINWPDDWVILWIYTERPPCQATRSGYVTGCNDMINALERVQRSKILIYYTFSDIVSDQGKRRGVPSQIKEQVKKLSNVKLSNDATVDKIRKNDILATIARRKRETMIRRVEKEALFMKTFQIVLENKITKFEALLEKYRERKMEIKPEYTTNLSIWKKNLK